MLIRKSKKLMKENQTYVDEIDLRELSAVLWRGKYFVIIFTIIMIAIGSLYLRYASTKYEVSILLAPVQEVQATPNFGGLGGLASFAGISLPTGSATDFSKYKIMLNTKEIAVLIFSEKVLIQELFSREWDSKLEAFREPEQANKTLVKNYIKQLLTGRQPREYIQPNPARLKKFISSNVSISVDKKSEYLTLSAESPNPKLLMKLLVSMIETTDKLFKRKFIKQANDAVQFYQVKISKARSQEHREILATLIAKEERKLLLATRDGPFGAEILTGPNISLDPTSPKTNMILVVCVLFGIALSSGFLLIRSLLSKSHDK